MSTLSLPVLGENHSLFQYLAEIKRFPSLEAGEEYMLAKRFVEHQDIEAAQKLVTSHLKLVPKVAMSFKGYGLPLLELISEGNIGLMQAVRKFDPDLGFRLTTYALWWIKAAIQDFILRSWSLVKIGTTAAQKKLFFNLRKMRNKIEQQSGRPIDREDILKIAKDLNVSEKEVISMNSRLVGGDVSLNDSFNDDTEDSPIDFLEATEENQEVAYAARQDMQYKQRLFYEALQGLNERERQIITARKLKENASTLEELSQRFAISRERVRQIEEAAMKKMSAFVQKALPAA